MYNFLHPIVVVFFIIINYSSKVAPLQSESELEFMS